MTKIMKLDEIKAIVQDKKNQIINDIEQGFIQYSQGQTVVPPVGELSFADPPGDVHIKYGFIKRNKYFVIKIASIFYENKNSGLRPNNGMMLLFKQSTGEPVCILLDMGYLTQVRTAAAGAVVAKYLAPKNVMKIGVYGAGTQARMQLEYLTNIIPCRDVTAWGVNQEELSEYRKDMAAKGFIVTTTLDPQEVADNCNFIITATPSKKPVFKKGFLKKGVHITAMGSDTPEKQELESDILRMADRVVADSLPQSNSRGEIHHALDAKAISTSDLIELGHLISDSSLHRSSDDQVTIADLTGVAVQDIQISKLVYEASLS